MVGVCVGVWSGSVCGVRVGGMRDSVVYGGDDGYGVEGYACSEC